MRSLDQIRGYANVFNEWSAPFGDDIRAIVKPGAYRLWHHPIVANVMHGACGANIATTWDRSLRLWQDCYGLAIELDVPATSHGAGLLKMVADGVCGMSMGLEIIASTTEFVDGVACHTVTKADIDHVTICPTGAFPSACCWLASARSDRMSPAVAIAARQWNLGRIVRKQTREANRAMLDRMGKAAIQPVNAARRWRPEPILINGLEPSEFLRVSGLTYSSTPPKHFGGRA